MKLTKTLIDKLDVPPCYPDGKVAQLIYRDSDLPGFAVRVTSHGVKSYVIERRIGGKSRRITLGRFEHLTVEEARNEAFKVLGTIAKGIDPVLLDRAERAKRVTLHQAFNDYLTSHPHLTRGTVNDYLRSRDGAFKDWHNKALVEITKDMIERRHRDLGRTSPARANNSMRVLRAIFNYAIDKYDDLEGHPILQSNPVSRLSRTRGWFRVERRRTLIKNHQLPDWYKATLQLKSETARDYLHFTLLTGLRRNESASLTWANVDFDDRTITIQETKNHEPHTLPLSDFLIELLRRRQAQEGCLYVFPSDSQEGHFTDPSSAINRVIELSEVEFCIHDLRRTFITAAESMDISAYALKRMLNHKMTNDVTAGYIIPSVERLREPMQRITDHFIRLLKPEDKIIFLNSYQQTKDVKDGISLHR